ncbi:MAG: hypothetical protein KF760_26950 [Candidatus Eremiobacteraeota bacterium]|nr:hypothetical protein [Candidatus Eremiobacteraeota bacterium]MCW5869621.1 hypothetical protein [Candidatus Eremiobacteraeota bacterium]
MQIQSTSSQPVASSQKTASKKEIHIQPKPSISTQSVPKDQVNLSNESSKNGDPSSQLLNGFASNFAPPQSGRSDGIPVMDAPPAGPVLEPGRSNGIPVMDAPPPAPGSAIPPLGLPINSPIPLPGGPRSVRG